MLSWWFASAHSAFAIDLDTLITRSETYIINPVIVFLVTLALLTFIWGVIQFIRSQSGGEEKSIADGKQHIIWGLAGLMIMLSVYGIMHLIINTFGITGPNGAITLPR